MWQLSLLPFAIQAIGMFFDEGYFHIKRGLPKWERIGHPIDTLSVLFCMGIVLFVPFSSTSLAIYILAAAFSCILVTKDEFVHKHHCPSTEQWLHALLFTLHPITLACAGFMWPVIQGVEVAPWISNWLNEKETLHLFLQVQFGTMVVFIFYQIIFWNFLWKEKQAQ
jgi:hypothetical protein